MLTLFLHINYCENKDEQARMTRQETVPLQS